MTNFQRINITLPKKLVKRSRVLIDEGLYSSFSELVKEGIKDEIKLNRTLIEKKKILDKWLKEDDIKGEDTSHLTQEEIIEKIRKERDVLWEEKYKKWFKGL